MVSIWVTGCLQSHVGRVTGSGVDQGELGRGKIRMEMNRDGSNGSVKLTDEPRTYTRASRTLVPCGTQDLKPAERRSGKLRRCRRNDIGRPSRED